MGFFAFFSFSDAFYKKSLYYKFAWYFELLLFINILLMYFSSIRCKVNVPWVLTFKQMWSPLIKRHIYFVKHFWSTIIISYTSFKIKFILLFPLLFWPLDFVYILPLLTFGLNIPTADCLKIFPWTHALSSSHTSPSLFLLHSRYYPKHHCFGCSISWPLRLSSDCFSSLV